MTGVPVDVVVDVTIKFSWWFVTEFSVYVTVWPVKCAVDLLVATTSGVWVRTKSAPNDRCVCL